MVIFSSWTFITIAELQENIPLFKTLLIFSNFFTFLDPDPDSEFGF
jgi:hypothetical protein